MQILRPITKEEAKARKTNEALMEVLRQHAEETLPREKPETADQPKPINRFQINTDNKNIVEEAFSSEIDSQTREFDEDNLFSTVNKVTDSDSGYIRNLFTGAIIFFGTMLLLALIMALFGKAR